MNYTAEVKASFGSKILEVVQDVMRPGWTLNGFDPKEVYFSDDRHMMVLNRTTAKIVSIAPKEQRKNITRK